MNNGIKKITEQNLDDSLKRSLHFKYTKIGYDDLSPDIVTTIKSGSNAKTAYNDEELRNRIVRIENEKKGIADITELINKNNENYFQKNEVIDKIKELLAKTKREIDADITTKIPFRNKVIDESMLSDDLQYKVNARYNNLFNTVEAKDPSAEFKNDLNALKQETKSLKEYTKTLQSILQNNVIKKTDYIAEGNLDASLRTKINNKTVSNLDLEAFNPETRTIIETLVHSDIVQMGKRVTDLEAKFPTREERTIMFLKNGKLEYDSLVVAPAIVTTDKNIYDQLVEKIQSKDETPITIKKISIDLDSYDYLIYLNNTTMESDLYYHKDKSTEEWTISENSVYVDFGKKILYNVFTNSLYYLADTNVVTPIVKGIDENSTEKETIVTIGALGNTSFEIEKPLINVKKILLLDTFSKSRTFNKYINSEGMITVAYDNDKILLYNDTSKELKLKIIYNGI